MNKRKIFAVAYTALIIVLIYNDIKFAVKLLRKAFSDSEGLNNE